MAALEWTNAQEGERPKSKYDSILKQQFMFSWPQSIVLRLLKQSRQRRKRDFCLREKVSLPEQKARSVVSLDSDCDEDSVDRDPEAATHEETGLQVDEHQAPLNPPEVT